MKLDDVIADIDKDINAQEREINLLKNKKLKFQRIKEDCPGAHYENGAICVDNIWDKITCMRIENKRKYYSTSKINVKFLLSKKASLEGLKIYTYPLENLVAEIRHTYGLNRRKEIIIFDYKKIIPMDCPKRTEFIKRIKFHLIDNIMQNGLFITENSFEREEFTKLMSLK